MLLIKKIWIIRLLPIRQMLNKGALFNNRRVNLHPVTHEVISVALLCKLDASFATFASIEVIFFRFGMSEGM